MNIQEYYQQCTDPNGTRGSCQPFTTCPSLVNLLQTQSSNPQTREFLRRSQCGIGGNNPYVCCASSSPPQPISNPSQSRPPQNSANIGGGKLPTAPNCGLDAPDRIFGGENTKIDEFPWLVQLQYMKRE